MEPRALIDRLGGLKKTADLVHVTPDAVKKWRQNGIPTKHWPRFVSSTELTYADLEKSVSGREIRLRAPDGLDMGLAALDPDCGGETSRCPRGFLDE